MEHCGVSELQRVDFRGSDSTLVLLWVCWLWWFKYTWPMGSSIFRGSGLVGGSVSLCRWALRSPRAKALSTAEEVILLTACARKGLSGRL